MKSKIIILILIVSGAQSITFGQTKLNFYLHANGVTCMCPNAKVGETGTLNGVTYTKRIKEQINAINASKTCTSGIVDMSFLFRGQSAFNGEINSWDVSSVTDMSFMFMDAFSFNRPLINWDVSNVLNMTTMFFHAESFNQDIRSWDVSSVKTMNVMFASSNFNHPIGDWDVGNVIDMSSMFFNCKPFNQPINNWDVSNVTNMRDMFTNSEFNQFIGNWNVSNVTNMDYMFSGGSLNQDISKWCVKNIIVEPSDFSTNSLLIEKNKPKWGADCMALSNEDFAWLSNEINIYPNPFTSNVNIAIPDNVQVKHVQVMNNVGQTVYTSTTTELKLDHLQSGMYYLKITTDKGIFNEKLIKK